MKYKMINKKTKECEAEGVDIGGKLYVHYYNSRGSFSYDFGKWPSQYKYESIIEPTKEKPKKQTKSSN